MAHNIDSSPPLPADRDTEDTLHPTSDTLSAEHRDHSRAAPYGHITFGPHNHVRQPSTQESTPGPTSNDSDYSTSSSPPPLIEYSSDEDDPSDHHLEISDDTRNAIHRRYAQLLTNPHIPYPNPPRILAVEHTVFDIRTATNDSDSTPIYPDPSDSSDGETPQYWTENKNPTPPPPNSSPPPVLITDRQLMEWIETQLPWNIFRQTIPIYRDTPIELCGPPRLQRDLPNRTYMHAQAAPYADTLDSFNRISAFLHTGLSSSDYLPTLPPIIRKFYLNMPPTHSDHLENSPHRPPTTSRLGG
jgi:hypothetical protein